jgi:hypothetical protein
MIKNMLILIMLIGFSNGAIGQVNGECYLYTTPNGVSVFEPETGIAKTVYCDSMVFLYNFVKYNVQSSITGRYISICGNRMPDVAFIDNESVEYTHVAVIIDLENDSKWTIQNVEKVSWSPHHDLFAYIGGENIHQGDYYYSTGAWLVDPGSKEKNGIFIEQLHFDDIYWRESDNNIYLESSGVVKYDPLTKEIKKTPYRSCNISPDGKYYFIASLEGELAAFIRVQNNSELTIVLEDEKDMPFGLQCHMIEWTIRDDVSVAYVSDASGLFEVDMSACVLKRIIPPSPDIDPIGDLVGFRQGRPVWAKISGDKAELFYY